MFEIEKNVALPPQRWKPKSEFRVKLEALEVGDALNCGSIGSTLVSGKIGAAARALGREFTCRKIDGILRVHRTA